MGFLFEIAVNYYGVHIILYTSISELRFTMGLLFKIAVKYIPLPLIKEPLPDGDDYQQLDESEGPPPCPVRAREQRRLLGCHGAHDVFDCCFEERSLRP